MADTMKCTRTDCEFYTGYYDTTDTACGAGVFRCCGLRKKPQGDRPASSHIPQGAL